MLREDTPSPAVGHVVWVGLLGLAAAMGIGRFAYTPLLPLMQAEGLGAAAGAWLAGANYLGYLAGALAVVALHPSPQRAARWGLVAVAATTLLMGATASLPAWLLLRALAGVASAFVLVGVSAWALPRLAVMQASHGVGWVYAGVGAGMIVAGLAAMGAGRAGGTSASGWVLLGALAAAVVLACWRALGEPAPAPAVASPAATHAAQRHWLLVLCYGALGFGYIIPATFLPALARRQIADPAVFGWTWPVFGLAAAASTVAGSRLLRHLPPRTLWAACQLVMAAGVLLPVFESGLAALVASAVCVGGTFMVATMAGFQEARRVGGAAAARLMAALTAAFGTGQLLGPLALGRAASLEQALVVPSWLAFALLLASSATLMVDARRGAARQRCMLQPSRSCE